MKSFIKSTVTGVLTVGAIYLAARLLNKEATDTIVAALKETVCNATDKVVDVVSSGTKATAETVAETVADAAEAVKDAV